MKRRNSMRVRHIVLSLFLVLALSGVLVGCELLGFVSIDLRVTDFESALNAANRSTLYENFHPTLTNDFQALKNTALTIDVPMPPLVGADASYVLTIDNKADPATGVLVTVTGGPAGFSAPKHLKLVMDTTGIADYRIVSLALDDGAYAYTVLYQ
jgi:hypothetical protein